MENSCRIHIFGGHIGQYIMDTMKTKAERELNPQRYPLSQEARARLHWMYVLKFECGNNVSKAARKLGLSRTWLSQIHGKWLNSGSDPRALEPESKAPHSTERRNRISEDMEKKILEIRTNHPVWGKDKIAGKINYNEQENKMECRVERQL